MESKEIVDRLIDESFKSLLRNAKHGDLLAAQRLHEWLADDLRKNQLTPFRVELLASMHEAIAEGTNASVATYTAPPPNRRISARRDAEVFMHVLMVLSGHEVAGDRPSVDGACQLVAPSFDIAWRTVKKIYLKERKRHSLER